jgi:hypothetical protein
MFKPTNIQSPEAINSICEEIQAFLESHYNADNPTSVVERAQKLEAYMALSGKILADSQYHYNELTESSIVKSLKEALDKKLSITTLNKYVESVCRDYKFLVSWTDRINRSCTHQLDMCRTIISKLKTESYNKL